MVITRVDEKTGQTLLWCGSEPFDIMKIQRNLNRSGLVINEIREDKWATLGPISRSEETKNAVQE